MKKALIALIVVFSLVLAGEVGFILMQQKNAEKAAAAVPETAAPETTAEITEPETTETVPETTEETEPVTEETTEATTEPEETEPETTEAPTEPEPKEKHYWLTFVGDCTLGSDRSNYGAKYSFIDTVGEDYGYPFRNVEEYFKNDDFTIANLEGVLADEGKHSGAMFTFRGPTAYTKILTGSSVEAVTLANNHSMDYGKDGYASTKKALDEAGVTYVEKDNYAMYTTESGLKIGMYAIAFTMDGTDMRAKIGKMRSEGADIIIVAAHWGVEGSYRPSGEQTNFAHACIDYGADIVYGSHPHVLQKIEVYKDKPIFYSMGNFCFGGNHWPPDLDSVVLQQEVIRDENGEVYLGELRIIPVSCNSLKTGQNNFQPTPYAEGSDLYKRVISKLDGSFKGPNLNVDYNTPKPTTPPETEPVVTVPVAPDPAPEAPVPDEGSVG